MIQEHLSWKLLYRAEKARNEKNKLCLLLDSKLLYLEELSELSQNGGVLKNVMAPANKNPGLGIPNSLPFGIFPHLCACGQATRCQSYFTFWDLKIAQQSKQSFKCFLVPIRLPLRSHLYPLWYFSPGRSPCTSASIPRGISDNLSLTHSPEGLKTAGLSAVPRVAGACFISDSGVSLGGKWRFESKQGHASQPAWLRPPGLNAWDKQ